MMTAKEILDEHLNLMGCKLSDEQKVFVLFCMQEYAEQYHKQQLTLTDVTCSFLKKGIADVRKQNNNKDI